MIVETATPVGTAPETAQALKRYWFYFERKPGSYPERFMLAPGMATADLLAALRPVFTDRLQEFAFPWPMR